MKEEVQKKKGAFKMEADEFALEMLSVSWWQNILLEWSLNNCKSEIIDLDKHLAKL